MKMKKLMKKKRFKFDFDVTIEVHEMLMVSFVSGALFAKIRLLNCGSFKDYTDTAEVIDHKVRWQKKFRFVCTMVANGITAVLEPCTCRVSIRKEMEGGRSYMRLGYADINLAEFAGVKYVSNHCYLLDGYNSRSRQDNSLLKVTIDMAQLSGDSLFKVPPMHQCEVTSASEHVEGSSLHLENKGAGEDVTKVSNASAAVSTDTDPSQSPQFTALEKDGHRTSGTSGHCRLSSNVSKVSSGYLSCHVPANHIRQSSADGATIFHHHRVHSGSSDPGFVYGANTKHGKKTEVATTTSELRLNRTRVDANELVDELMSGINFSSETNEDGTGSLQLFVGKDGKAVLGSAARTSTQLTQPVSCASSTSTSHQTR